MKIGIYPGSFDPVTNGHMDIIIRASKLVDHLLVSVLINPQKKGGLFTIEERMEMLKKTTEHLPNVEIDSFSGLLVDYAREKKAHMIVRGLRAITDLEHEMQMAQINKNIVEEVETVFLVTNAQYSFLSSSAVRELAMFKGQVEDLVPTYVGQKLKEKFM
ncbi:pantetheine-phosphate adenylyltransferase [Sporanaerobium hydrogeniformans]|uniref:Pantetheine-phosphate adenylyltransferase n=1 Tax=Sporanaerobium hydrogeniformans TaxID=3072179 RepID=A0AC61DG18_9FIRM|nr:pantetheine-phosphate adenylyltransferase [Sporanaerobium hydrogeniformans]PHV71815.1 pantetheine-phosphate adenylyltransferase [Sporanaerobium hydrogeniformans]